MKGEKKSLFIILTVRTTYSSRIVFDCSPRDPLCFFVFFCRLNVKFLFLFDVLVAQATNEVVTRVPKTTQAEMEAAVASCKAAYKEWSNTTVLTRQQLMFKYQALVKRDLVSLESYIMWIAKCRTLLKKCPLYTAYEGSTMMPLGVASSFIILI